ncbi:major histocompatibility complex class I-related gene protein-like [Micropterus salmoides]|uniref:major histocompatibility complex class I-related gene protein-like n=1 Tax=Micropterus salmoides TaxID=27706 RepID=UPI0018EA641B|nr:major histocompatibility complex class I-related gene protein-like [Micropterus salmoides]XP_038570832.1 major histocompatibility complex class I-related gene protein-like [Micropterus salmoides]
MKILVFLVLLGISRQGAAAVTHSLKYFYTASSGVPNFPEFVAVGLVDEVQVFHYDSNTRRAEPRQDWMSRVTEEYPNFWEGNTHNCEDIQDTFIATIDILKKRFNQIGGVHVFQRMVGCEWDEETGEVNGFTEWGYDGKDFISFVPKTETWIVPTPQANITRKNWATNKNYMAQTRTYFRQICPDWLKTFVSYGRSSLLRTDLPSVSLLQKTPSSPISCHATGFYPDRAKMFWRKDGEELHEDVKILPNNDGSFQMSVDLNAPPENWGKYECVFHLSGWKDDIVTKLDKANIRTNRNAEEKPANITLPIIAGVLFLLLVLFVVIGFITYKKKNGVL